jgi:hypothetical protein
MKQAGRRGVRAIDLLDPEVLADKISIISKKEFSADRILMAQGHLNLTIYDNF